MTGKYNFELYNYVSSGVFVINKDYDILFWNNNLEHWTGLKAENVIGKKAYEVFPKLNDFIYRSRLKQTFDGGPPVVFSAQLHKSFMPVNPFDRREKIYHIIVNAIPADNNNEYYAVFNIDDITELSQRISDFREMRDKALEEIERRKQVESELRKSEENLKELNATKDKFFSIIAHDLKNPLNVFSSVSDLLEKMFDQITKEEQIYFIREINNSAKKLNTLLENLLNWSRSQRGKLEVNKEVFDFYYLGLITYETVKPNAESKRQILEFNVEPEKYFCYADRNMIEFVLRNLLTNAIKFTPEGGIISVNCENLEDFVQVKVSDTGVGISEEDLQKLFRIDIHHTTIGTSHEKGTGLGLILCKEFVEKNGGTISVQSLLNVGTTFTFTIPRHKQEQ